jgi:hypothetical protein
MAVEDTAGWKKGFAGAVSIYKVLRCDSAVITCSSEWCVQVVNKSNSPIYTQSIN